MMDAATGSDLGSLEGHEGELLAIALSPDETKVAAATAEGPVRLWDRESGESRTVPGHGGAARRVAFSPDGRFLISAGDDGRVHVWADDLPADPAALRAFLASAGGEGATTLLDSPGAIRRRGAR
jgi:WD40 repeat protein